MTPFAYPKSRHARTQTPPQYGDYRRYKPVLQAEFAKRCVYCCLPDHFKKASFGVDHFRPKKRFPDLRTAYDNLFYACDWCNVRKGQHWSSNPNELIPNPCDDVMTDHLKYHGDKVQARSARGRFTLKLLDLNADNPSAMRESFNTILSLAKDQLAQIKKLLTHVRKQSKVSGAVSPAEARLLAKQAQVEKLVLNLLG